MLKLRFIIAFVFAVVSVNAQRSEPGFNNLQIAWQLVTNFYVDSVNREDLAREAIEAMLKKLDPHSVLIPAEEVNAMNEPLDGNFEGVGIEFTILNDTLTVVSTMVGGPSDKVGIKVGDRIVNINGTNVAAIGISNPDVFAMLRGRKGTKVDVVVIRRNSDDLLNFQVTRDKIPIHSIEAAYMATPSTGYIKISRFAATTHDEFVVALKSLKKKGMNSLVLDLRGNGGGYLKAALDIADEFLDGGKLLLYTQGAAIPRREHKSGRGGLWQKGDLIVLVDETSASASEIVAGAIQDWDRGVIMGRRSFGKGLVQRPFTLPDGAEIRLTIANYYTPSGRSIQKPYNNGVDDYRSEIHDRLLNGELTNGDSIIVDSHKYYQTMVKKRSVYGGGGIVPDVFVPLDTSMYTDFYRQIVSKGIMNRVVMDYMDDNRDFLKLNYTEFELFSSNYSVDDKIWQLLFSESESKGIEYSQTQFDVSEELIHTQIKALIARDIWGASEYYMVMNPLVSVVQKAIDLVENRDVYSQIVK